MIRACIFDLGGTIVDRYSLTPFLSLKKAFLKNKLYIRDELIYKDMGISKSEHIRKITNDPEVKHQFYELEFRDIRERDRLFIYNDFNEIQKRAASKINIIPETKDIIDYLRNKDILIGVTTGFNKEITNIIHDRLDNEGIYIDKYVSSTCLDKPARPYPYMINHIMDEFKIDESYNVIKLDDTVIGLEEGRAAHCWTAGVSRWSTNMMVKSLDESYSLTCDEIKEKNKISRNILKKGRPHYILDTLNDLPEVLDILGMKVKISI